MSDRVYLNPLPQIPGASWIELTKGYYALLDDYLAKIAPKFYVKLPYGHGKTPYAIRRNPSADDKNRRQGLHQWVFEKLLIDATQEIDHINQNGLDNRRDNLRFATHSQNCVNKTIRVNNTSGFIGVHWHIRRQKYIARIYINNKSKHLGLFDNPEDAARAYDRAAVKYFGIEFAHTNFPKSDYLTEIAK